MSNPVANQQRIDAIYQTYLDIVQPLIFAVEVESTRFPVELLNEIRAIFTHIAKTSVPNVPQCIIASNIEKAESHLKRATLDCFKFMCVIYDIKYVDFSKRFRGIDFASIHDGKFLLDVSRSRERCIRLHKEAKKIEAKSGDVAESFESWQLAYVEYQSQDELIIEAIGCLEKARLRAKRHRIFEILISTCALAGIPVAFYFWVTKPAEFRTVITGFVALVQRYAHSFVNIFWN